MIDPPAILGGTPALDGVPPLPRWPQPDDAQETALVEVFHSGKWGSTHGSVVRQFEQEFASLHQASHGVAVSNGTMALVAALRAAGIGIGDEVLVPSYTFVATASAPLFVGAVPVFVDVDPTTHLIDPTSMAHAISPRTRAVIPVHLAGAVADMDTILDIARRAGLVVIEDCAQAIGASWHGRPVGALGDMGAFSFQTSKNMTAGEGGLVLTNDEELATAVYSCTNLGRVPGGGWYEHGRTGFNLRLTEFQAALLRPQLPGVAEQNRQRDVAAAQLTGALDAIAGISVDRTPEGVTAHGRHLFLLRLPGVAHERRDAVVRALVAEGVLGASGGYPALHRNTALLDDRQRLVARLGQPEPTTSCPVTDQLCEDTIWLPHHVLLAEPEQIEAICSAFARVLAAIDDLPGA